MEFTKQIIIGNLASKPQLKVCDYTYVRSGISDLGLPTYTMEFVSPPKNYRLVEIDENLRIAILEDLDYAPAV